VLLVLVGPFRNAAGSSLAGRFLLHQYDPSSFKEERGIAPHCCIRAEQQHASMSNAAFDLSSIMPVGFCHAAAPPIIGGLLPRRGAFGIRNAALKKSSSFASFSPFRCDTARGFSLLPKGENCCLLLLLSN
jgi:hypothetical protein